MGLKYGKLPYNGSKRSENHVHTYSLYCPL
jgi:hypothetical protein